MRKKAFRQKVQRWWNTPLSVHRWLCWNRLKRWNASPIAWGVLLTIYVTLYALWLGFGGDCKAAEACGSRLERFAYLNLNEVGDTIAGFGSLLAFVWLIATVMLQSQELKAQRKELRQQRMEWKKISAAQDAQVRILEKQGEIFAEEQLQRRQDRAKSVLDANIDAVAILIEKYAAECAFEINSISLAPVAKRQARGDDTYLGNIVVGSCDQMCRSLPEALAKKCDMLRLGEIRVSPYKRDRYPRIAVSLRKALSDVLKLQEELAEDQVIRIRNAKISESLHQLECLHRLIGAKLAGR